MGIGDLEIETVKGVRQRWVCPHAGRRGGGDKISKVMWFCV